MNLSRYARSAGGILSQVRGVGGENEAEQVIRVLGRDRVRLGSGERFVARDRGDASHIVPLVEVERAEL